MLSHKQSLRPQTESTLVDYGADDTLNENADIEWVNKVISRFVFLMS